MNIKALILLYYNTIKNEYKEKYFSKNFLYGSLFFFALIISNIGFGYYFGLVITNFQLKFDILLKNIATAIQLLSIIVILGISISPLNFLNKINLSSLNLFPINKFLIILFKLIIGLIDLRFIMFLVFLITMIIKIGGFGISFNISFLIIAFSFSYVLLLHMLSELLKNVIRLITLISIQLKILLLTFLFIFFVLLILNEFLYNLFIDKNILALNINVLLSLLFNYQTIGIIQIITLNIITCFLLFIIIMPIEIYISDLMLSYNQNTIYSRRELFFNKICRKFLNHYLIKDLKYLLRGKQPIMAIFTELLILFFVYLLSISNIKIFDSEYLIIALQVISTTIMWDIYLNNYWGYEKSGFGFFIYSNINYKSLIFSKSISFIFIKIPLILISTFVLCYIYSFNYFFTILLLSLVLNLILMILSNYVSNKNPISINLNEDSFSKSTNNVFSIIGIYIYIIGSAFLFFILYEFGSVVFYIILVLLLCVFLFVYKITLNHTVSTLKKHKENIYEKLVRL